MICSLTTFATRTSLLLILAAGLVGKSSAQQTLLEEEKTSSLDAEVTVTIAVPEDEILSGTAIITIEDITVQDVAPEQLAAIKIDAAGLMHNQSTIAVPIDLNKVSAGSDVNVAVHIDSDNDGAMSDGDWISDSIVNAITNDKMDVIVDIIQIGV